jgi:hypothetical protein
MRAKWLVEGWRRREGRQRVGAAFGRALLGTARATFSNPIKPPGRLHIRKRSFAFDPERPVEDKNLLYRNFACTSAGLRASSAALVAWYLDSLFDRFVSTRMRRRLSQGAQDQQN